MDNGDAKSLSDIVVIHNPVLRSVGVLAALSGLSTRLPVTPLNQVLSVTLLSMTILLWLELRSRVVRMISLDRRFVALLLTDSGQVLRLVWFVIMLDVASILFVVILLFAYPATTSRLLLIEVFVISVPLVVARVIGRGIRSFGSVQPGQSPIRFLRRLTVGAVYLIFSAPILLIACIYVPEFVTYIRDGLGLRP